MNYKKIMLFKDNNEYKDDVFVSVNGENWVIQRGVEVSVPDYVAEVIENCLKQDKESLMLMEDLVRQSEKSRQKAESQL